MNSYWKPKSWLAILFALMFKPFVFLYVNRLKLFWGYIFLTISLVIIDNQLQVNPPEDAWYKDIYLSWLLFVVYPIHACVITRNYDVTKPRTWYASWWGTSSCVLLVLFIIIFIKAFYFELFSIPSKSMIPTLNPGDHLLISKKGFGNYRYQGFQLLKTEPTQAPKRGDIIVFQYPKNTDIDYVKRVIGLPGDKLIYREKTIYLKALCVETKVETRAETSTNSECPPYVVIKKFDKEAYQNGLSIYKEKLSEQSYSVIIDPKVGSRISHYYKQEVTAPDEWIVPDEHYFVLGDNRDNSLDSRFFGFVPASYIIGKSVYVW